MIANGLIAAWQQGDHSPEGRMTSIIQQFSAMKIDLQSPYLNPRSQDIYTPLF
ncbi:MAG: T3SS effector HopA1 family protein [Sphaerospermopsis kisseleviana]